jgi:hypothetical protein
MYLRLVNNGIGFVRPRRGSVYTMLNHDPTKKNSRRFDMLKKSVDRMKKDGLNSVQYELLEFTRYPMFTFISIDVGKQPKHLMRRK